MKREYQIRLGNVLNYFNSQKIKLKSISDRNITNIVN